MEISRDDVITEVSEVGDALRSRPLYASLHWD